MNQQLINNLLLNLSNYHETSNEPSVENLQQLTFPECPLRECDFVIENRFPPRTCHNLTRSSLPQEANI